MAGSHVACKKPIVQHQGPQLTPNLSRTTGSVSASGPKLAGSRSISAGSHPAPSTNAARVEPTPYGWKCSKLQKIFFSIALHP